MNLKALGRRSNILSCEFCFVVDFLLIGEIESHYVVCIEEITEALDQFFLHYPTWDAHLFLMGYFEVFLLSLDPMSWACRVSVLYFYCHLHSETPKMKY